MCRSMYTCEHRSTVSKRVAAEWVIERHPRWEQHIRRALAARLTFREGREASLEEREATAAFVDFALRQLPPVT